MYCITDEQIEFILDDIRRNGIETEDLQLNLLDHICCILEQSVQEGDRFEDVYQQVIQQFYKTELKEIESETQYLLTFKNYYAMKRSMMISGASSALLLFTGSVFKIMHWPGAGILLVLGITFFSLLFLPVLFLLKSRELSMVKDKAILGLGVSMGALLCMASLFKVMHWPGANVMWMIALMISSLVLLPLYFFNGIRNPDKKFNTIVTTFILIGVLGVLLTLTKINITSSETAYQEKTEMYRH